MKKLSVFFAVMTLLAMFSLKAQITVNSSYDFEDGQLTGWTSSSSTNVTVEENTNIAINGSKYARVKHGSAEQFLQSPLITVQAGEQVRLEFNHIPMTKSGVKVQLVPVSGTPILLSGNNCYDNKFRPNIVGQGNQFKYSNYYSEGLDISKISVIKPSMWQHEIYYLNGKLNNATSFYIKFVMPNTTDNGYGWLIDDVKIYTTTSASANVPKFNKIIKCPNMANYAYCSDAEIEFDVSSQVSSLSTIADSLYIEYYTPYNENIVKVKLTKNNEGHYTANIPYLGIDSTAYWRAVVTDAFGNQTRYPFTGNFQKFTYVRPYMGSAPIKENATGSDALIFSTKFAKSMQQIRYSATELKEAGYSAGFIGGFYFNIKSRPASVVTLQNFKVYIGSIESDYVINTMSPEANKTENVVNKVEYVLPEAGWQYLEFDDNKEFIWDGESDILLRVCYEAEKSYGETKVQSYSAGNNEQYKTHKFEQSASAAITACNAMFNTADGVVAFKPNLRFNFVNKCYFSYDAGIRQDTLLSPAPAKDCNGNLSKIYTCKANIAVPLKVMLRNDGLLPLTQVKVRWMLDDNKSDISSSLWTGTMQPLNPNTKQPTDTATQYTAIATFMAPAGVHTLKVWTEMPDNNHIDWNYSNDTITVTLFVTDGAMNGEYAIGGPVGNIASNKVFKTFDEAFIMLINSKVGGACTFNIANNSKDTIYNTVIKFPTCIQGLSENNTLTFVNKDSSHDVVFEPNIGGTSNIFDLSDIKHFKFKNLKFSLNPGLNMTNLLQLDMIKLNENSSDIVFDSCQFLSYKSNNKYYDRVASLINLENSSNIFIENCVFDSPAKIQVKIEGKTADSISNVKITNSQFNIVSDYKQAIVENAIYAKFVKNFNVIGNKFETSMDSTNYNNFTTPYYALNINDINNADISKNRFKLYSLTGALLNSVNNSIFANNLVSLSNINTNPISYNQYGLYLQSGNNNTVAYNNIYGQSLENSTKKVHGLSLGLSNVSALNNNVVNNIIVSDGYGYAVSLKPSAENSFKFYNNIYYKKNTIDNLPLFSHNTNDNVDVDTWKTETKDVNSFYDDNPLFMAWDNLYTTNVVICEKGKSIDNVKDDYFGAVRPATKQPCIGAREFDPPLNNIYVLKTGLKDYQTSSENTYSGCDLGKDSIFVEFKNISTNTIDANKVTFYYSVNGSTPVSYIYPNTIESNVVKQITFPTPFDFATTNGNKSFKIVAYSVFDKDTVKTNDTTSADVISYYRLPALTAQNVSVKYGNTLDVDITALCPNDSVYWFYKQDDTAHFYKGHSFTTGNLYSDSTIYFARRDEVPVIRISEIQYYKDANKAGITQGLPNYVSVNNAYELSNCSSEDIVMGGYQFVSYTGSTITQPYGTYTFPDNYILKAHSSVVLVATNSLSVGEDVAIAVNANKFKMSATTKGGFAILNSANKFIDALTVNGAVFSSSMNVPSNVWQEVTGQKIDVSTTSAGIIRKDVKSTNYTGWIVADEAHPMTVGTYNTELTDSTENLCVGYPTEYHIKITDVPNYDPGIIQLYADTISSSNYSKGKPFVSCGLQEATIKMILKNTGLQKLDSVPITCEVYEGDVIKNTYKTTYKKQMNKFDTAEVVLSDKVNLTAIDKDRNIIIKVYTSLESDIVHNNDTMYLYINSLYTPEPPTAPDVTVDYANKATITATSDNTIIWYKDESSLTELARGTTLQTPVLYEDTSYYVEAFVQIPVSNAIGADSSSSSSPSPSPLHAKLKNVREQYLLRADTLSAYGYAEGNINGFAIKIASVTAATGETAVNYSEFNVKIGKTTQTTLSTWEEALTTVYSDTLMISSQTQGWRDIKFTEPYYWDGKSDLIMEVCFSTEKIATVQTYTTSTDFVSSLSYKNNKDKVCDYNATSPSLSKIPYLRLNMELFACRSTRKKVNVHVQNAPTCDLGIESIVSPGDENITSGVSTPITVRIKNYGIDAQSSATINWKINSQSQTPYNWSTTTPLAQNKTAEVTLGNIEFPAGAVKLEVYINLNCDTIHGNDTIVKDFVACLGNTSNVTTLTINPNGDKYKTITEAINDLKTFGICGPINLDIADGTYNEQISISNINGVSETNTITFTGSKDADGVVIKYVPEVSDETSVNKDYLLKLEDVSNIYFKDIKFKSDSTFATLGTLNNTSDIHFDNIVFENTKEDKPSINLIYLTGKNDNLFFKSDTFYYGDNSIFTNVMSDGQISTKIEMDSCLFNDFKSSAVVISNFKDMKFRYNKVRAHENNNDANVTDFNNISGLSEISANEIVLTDGNKKKRNGIVVNNSSFEDSNPLSIANNSISITGSSKASVYGIDIESSNFVNIYYNTILLNVSSNNATARNLLVGKVNTNIQVRNNNLDNQCGGYAYYVEGDGAQILVSDNNNYITSGSKLTYWSNKDCATVEALHAKNNFDEHSVSIINKFRADTCLEFVSPTNIIYKAEPNELYTKDIYGNIRPVNPKPTIGAYEYQFLPIDAGIISVVSPVSSTSYIEGDDINISVVVQNFGNNKITSLEITGVLRGHKDSTDIFQTITETYSGNLNSLDSATYLFNGKFTAKLNTPYTDSLYVQLYTTLAGDTVFYNDTISLPIRVIPGKDLNCVSTKKQDANAKCGVDMQEQKIAVVIKNVGNKAVVPGDVINVTYEIRGETGQMKKTQTEQITFPYTYQNSSGNNITLADLQPNATIQYFTFATVANLQPTGGHDTNWTIKTYVNLADDSNPLNDTASEVTYVSYVSPLNPIAHDTAVYYGTYATARATQDSSLSIRWYKNMTDAAPFYKPNKYEKSTFLEITVPIYEDTTFYVEVKSNNSGSCPSEKVPVKVKVLPRCNSDLSAIEIVEPPAQPKKGYIYMSEDTVKVKLTNYGSQTQTGFTIACSIKPTVPSNAEAQVFKETCDASVMTDDTVIYAFKQLFDFTGSTSYQIKVWTENNNDCTHLNDTTPTIKVTALKGMINDSKMVADAVSLDITRVQLASMDNMSASISESYSDFTETVTPPELFKELKDSLLINISPSSDMKITEDTELKGWIKAWIDWNRDGTFDTVKELVYSAEALINNVNRTMIEVPEDAYSGFTLMRIIVSQDDSVHKFGPNPGNFKYEAINAGEIEDYKIHISPIKNVNAELVRFVTPARQDTVVHNKLVVRLRNAGKTELTSAKITWIYENDTNVYDWTGNLNSSDIADVELAEINLNLGHNHLKAYVDVNLDEYPLNDTIVLNNYVYPVYTLPYNTDFDETEKLNYDFFAYEADPKRPTNLWEIGTPDVNANQVIKSAYSKPICWKTNIKGQYKMNNKSILYSPMFDIQEIKPDTMSFMMRRDMGPGANMVVEYLNYKGVWKVLGEVNSVDGLNWYDSEDGFTKTNVAWEKSAFSMDAVSGDLGKILQFRFVFVSADGHIADGVAIDDFRVERALRDYDAGVTKIELTPDELPSYGQYFYPKVTIHNYGKKDIPSFKVCYLAEDMNIVQCEDVLETIPKGGDLEYTFVNGRYLNVAMPDPFTVMAYTRLNPNDLYTDNDTAIAYFVIGPLMNDVGLLEITEPLSKVSANDDIEVAVKLKNYGIEPIEEMPIYYSSGFGGDVMEVIHFDPALNNGDEYIYTFKTKYHTPFGTVNLKVWSGLEQDIYADNDTLYTRLQATNVASDIEAKYITLDDANSNDLGLQVAIVNHSSKVASNIVVGYYVNGDKDNSIEEIYKGGGELNASSTGYHNFARRINRDIYQSVCAYVKYVGDENTANDTTCSVYLGYRDMKADSIFVEQNVNPECLVQLVAHHEGTLAGKNKVKATYVLNGDYANPIKQTFEIPYDEPSDRQLQLTFSTKIPRNEIGKYDIVAWVDYEGDNNHSNDTTSKVRVQSYVGLEPQGDDDMATAFVVKQNKPNPFTENTVVEIDLPKSDEVQLNVVSTEGRVVYTYTNNFAAGKHYINLPLNQLPAGAYYYNVKYKKHRITKKMIKIK